MGTFADQARWGEIPGPHLKKFDSALWKAQLNDPSIDNDDRRIIGAALFFDSLLGFIRTSIQSKNLGISNHAIIRAIIGLQSINLKNIHNEAKPDLQTATRDGHVHASMFLEKTIALPTGQEFSPDEIITGLGDGARFIVSDLLTNTKSSGHDFYSLTANNLRAINREINIAIMYNIAVDYWLDCLGNGHEIVSNGIDTILQPGAPDDHCAFIASLYRRNRLGMQSNHLFTSIWISKLDQSAKMKLCSIKPVLSITTTKDTISRIKVRRAIKNVNDLSLSIGNIVDIMSEYYKDLSESPLPNYYNFTLTQIANSWLFLQSLSIAIFNKLRPANIITSDELAKCSPIIPHAVLQAALSESTGLAANEAQDMLDVLTFKGRKDENLWTQPLIKLDSNYHLFLPCVYSTRPIILAEGWMRQGGLQLDKKGGDFEKYIRKHIKDQIANSHLSNYAKIVDHAITFTTSEGRSEEIDFIFILGNTVMLAELKCILWPDTAMQFANYKETINGGVKQITRKELAVKNNLHAFIKVTKDAGHIIDESTKFFKCVISNSPIYSGFQIDDTIITDTILLDAFIDGELMALAKFENGHIQPIQKTKFYNNPEEAESVLIDYLKNPPQLKNIISSIKPRTVTFPIQKSNTGWLHHKTLKIESDPESIIALATIKQ